MMIDLMRQDQALPFESVWSRAAPPADLAPTTILASRTLSLWYGSRQALDRVSIEIPGDQVTAVVGPSGCGKSTFLRSLNRMNDRVPGARIEGQVLLRGADVYGRGVRSAELRRRIGLVHRRLDLRPKSIRESLRSHLRRHGFRKHLDDRIEAALRGGVLWDEVKDRLGTWVRELSDGQQVRLGVARALAVEPEVLLLDDPCSGLDSASAARIEELIQELGPRYAVVLATRDARQAARVASSTATFHLGRLARIEDTPTGRPV